MTRRDQRCALLAVLAAISALSWPVTLAQAALSVAYHVRYSQAAESVAVVGPLVGVATAGLAGWLCRTGRTDPASFGRAGALGGLLVGGVVFSTWEFLHHTYDPAGERFRLGLRTWLLGALWAAPLATPAGLLLGLTAVAIGRFVGVCEPPWLEGRPGLRGGAVAAIMLAQVGTAICLARLSSNGP